MEDPRLGVDRLRGMGVMGLTTETVRIMRQNFLLFSSFAAIFTIPCSIFAVLLVKALDIHHDYVLENFIAKGDVVIFGLKFKHTITPLAVRFGFILLSLAPTSWLNACVCTRGVVSIYRNEELATSIKNCFQHLQWVVLRIIASQSFLYCYVVIVWGSSLVFDGGGGYGFLPSYFALLFYHLPTSQVAILERENYGYRAVSRATDIMSAKSRTVWLLSFFSVSYFCVLKLVVDVSMRDSFPLWTKFVAFPAVVLLVTIMSIFWQVVYTLLYLSAGEVELDKLDRISPEKESRNANGDVIEPLLAAEVDRTKCNSNSQV